MRDNDKTINKLNDSEATSALIVDELNLVLQELRDIPGYPWTLKSSKNGLMLLDKYKTEIAKIDKSAPNYLILANFLAFAPIRFEKLIKELANRK